VFRSQSLDFCEGVVVSDRCKCEKVLLQTLLPFLIAERSVLTRLIKKPRWRYGFKQHLYPWVEARCILEPLPDCRPRTFAARELLGGGNRAVLIRFEVVIFPADGAEAGPCSSGLLLFLLDSGNRQDARTFSQFPRRTIRSI
jgi:hypothetical protein